MHRAAVGMAAVLCSRVLWEGSRCLRLRVPVGQLYRQPFRGHRLTPSDDEMYQRTTVTLLERESPEVMLVDGYSSHGFTINGDKVIGPCAIIPQAVLQWNVGSARDITEDSLALFHMIVPKIEVLVLGTGDRVERIDPKVLKFMRMKGIAVEVQDTPNACATFNFLTSEHRLTAAGLIPPPKASK
ncbi:NADH dehydrogenase [ubiquinone] 1 alpha subcomplex assembly factor 3 [Latimeria chalumnae]|uniref:NADH dehydrogenase [ubiquinone] 1 alpha subcomplex assembly factor 3 n=1 Tax=Latimeria chalumnae TaxID=7897 RepID=H3A2U4_LATCH|nr:PREDICTED: NADH dehydrogenase [ubiquinone] 1 alpha subcomplex assembly factor 3 [Latimeria chalumnae]|eukprot:XP_006010919.1 PREDICTED: NADH dehydrogenase [ubiquinone] 1 alpha subcomplex assembly factor 3 [Latimeria chalumnae]